MDEPRQRRAHVVSVHDHINHAVLAEIFRALETVRQFLANRLFDHALPGKADQRAGFSNVNVAEHRVRSAHSAGSGVCEHHDVGNARFTQHLYGDSHARYLH